MTDDQKADLDAVLSKMGQGSEPSAGSAPEAPQEAGTAPAASQGEAAPPAPPEAPQEAPAAPEPTVPKYQQILDRIRAARTPDVAKQQEQELQESIAYAKRIQEAAQYGPDAVLKAAGVEKPKIDIAKLLAPDDDEPQTPKEVRALEEKVSKLDSLIAQLQEERAKEQQEHQQHMMQATERQELDNIRTFVEAKADKYQYLTSARELGSEKDLYNGMVSLYNQGYSPNYEDMADIVESRIESLLDYVAGTSKFADFVQKKFGVQLGTQAPGEGKTLNGAMAAESPAGLDISQLSDEDQRKAAIKAAYAARDEALKKLGNPI